MKRERKTAKKHGKKQGKILDNKTRKQSKKVFEKLNCAPDTNRKHKFSCFNTNKLMLIRNAWNARHPDCKITIDDPKKIWNKLKTYMGATCNNEMCWLKQQFVKNNLDSNLFHNTFAPKSPNIWKKNPNEWLDSLNILSVIKQYEKAYECFDFIGPSPIDYDTHYDNGECVWKELCEFELKEFIKNKKTKIGVIFNLDPHYKSGSHWVSLFINIKKQEIYYFDSNGIPPPKQIDKLMDTIIEQASDIGLKFKKMINNKQHQYSDTECGMYSLYFIINMLKGKNFQTFIKTRVPDSKMVEFRNIYFN
tara:strand:+ start:12856 stop:13773 length:918 start_codon:yes stop_codon:yes gene_type:complete